MRAKTAGQQRSKKEDRPGGEKLADEDFEEENGSVSSVQLLEGCESYLLGLYDDDSYLIDYDSFIILDIYILLKHSDHTSG